MDMRYRLTIAPVVIPPLRERASDIPLLAKHFLDKYIRKEQKHPRLAFADDALALLSQHKWPGNVRELEKLVEYAVIQHGDQDFVHGADIAPVVATEPTWKANTHGDSPQSLGWLDSFANDLAGASDYVQLVLLERAITRNNGKKTEVANELGMNYSQLRRTVLRLLNRVKKQ